MQGSYPEDGYPSFYSPRPCVHIVLCIGFCVLAAGIIMTVLAGHPSLLSVDSSTLKVFGYAFLCAGGVIILKAVILFLLDKRIFPSNHGPHIDDVIATTESSSPEYTSAWSRAHTYHVYYPEFSTTEPPARFQPHYQEPVSADLISTPILSRFWDPPPPYPGKSTLT